jgi:hypothetical protein
MLSPFLPVTLLAGKLRDENECADRDIKRLQKEVEELSAQLEECKLMHAKYSKDKEAEADVLSDAVLQLQEENQKMTDTLESLQLSVRQKDSVHALSEQRFRSEVRRLEEEKRHLQNYLNDGENSAEQLEVLRSTLSNALSSNEGLVRESRDASNAHRHAMDMLQQTADRAESNVVSLRQELKSLRQEYDVVLMEREEAAGALRRAIEMAKSLSAKVSDEQAKREEAESRLAEGQKRMQDILRAKEQVSYAVLDALHKERALQTSVSRTLSEMRKREADEERLKSMATSRDSLEVSFSSDGGGDCQEPDGAKDDPPTAFSRSRYEPPSSGRPAADVMEIWKNSVLAKDLSFSQAVGRSAPTGAGGSASNTPNPRPPLTSSGMSSNGSFAAGQKRGGVGSPMRNMLPESPEHLDLAHSPSVRNHLIGDLKR